MSAKGSRWFHEQHGLLGNRELELRGVVAVVQTDANRLGEAAGGQQGHLGKVHYFTRLVMGAEIGAVQDMDRLSIENAVAFPGSVPAKKMYILHTPRYT